MLKQIFLLPIRACAGLVYKMSDFVVSAMRLSALNWLKIGRRAADAGLDVAHSARTHARELSQRMNDGK
jgi:hypothetical protein